MTRDAIRGSSDRSVLILTSLADAPEHGYALIKDVEEFAGVKLGASSLYGALAKHLGVRPTEWARIAAEASFALLGERRHQIGLHQVWAWGRLVRTAIFILCGYTAVVLALLGDEKQRGAPLLEDDICMYPPGAVFGVDTVPAWL
jgi:hypothetical protein